MASPPIKPLNGHGGYLRWKESMLLRFHTLGVAHVLSKAPPSGDGASSEAAEKWARDDAICRGHILAALSDRLLPDYARFATAAELWRALARTYDVDTTWISTDRFHELRFDQGGPLLLLEQIAHAQALGAAANLGDNYVTFLTCDKLPETMSAAINTSCDNDKAVDMDMVWNVARRLARMGNNVAPECLWRTTH